MRKQIESKLTDISCVQDICWNICSRFHIIRQISYEMLSDSFPLPFATYIMLLLTVQLDSASWFKYIREMNLTWNTNKLIPRPVHAKKIVVFFASSFSLAFWQVCVRSAMCVWLIQSWRFFDSRTRPIFSRFFFSLPEKWINSNHIVGQGMRYGLYIDVE